MSEDSDLEKTEEASPRRLEKAREEGQIARSRELGTLVMLSCGMAALWAMGSSMSLHFSQALQMGLHFDRATAFEPDQMLLQAGYMLEHAALALLPVLGLMFVAALVSPLLLGGWLLSTDSLGPKFSRMDPVAGLKRMFSTDALAELIKTLLKSVLIGGVAWWVLSPRLPAMMDLMGAPVHTAMASMLHLLGVSSALIVASLLLVALIDAPYQLWSHNHKLRMTLEEVKKENKESDGDPQVKAQIRRQRQQMARRRMMAEVPKADIVVTNPTHFAVALKYDDKDGKTGKGSGAPRVVAKGADLVALRIKALAQEHRIPVLEAPPLTRALFKHTKLGHEIPVALYAAVAEVLAWAYQLGKQRAGANLQEPRDLPVPEDMDPMNKPEFAGAAA